MRTELICLMLVAAAALAGCGPALAATAAPREPTENPLQLGATPEPGEMPSDSPPVEKYVALSKSDLADRLHIDAEAITLVRSRAMIWPDAALGCPGPGQVYARGRVPGYQIWLKAGDREYEYHTDLGGQVVLCLADGPAGDAAGGATPQIGVPIK